MPPRVQDHPSVWGSRAWTLFCTGFARKGDALLCRQTRMMKCQRQEAETFGHCMNQTVYPRVRCHHVFSIPVLMTPGVSSNQSCVFRFEPQSPNNENITVRQKRGFPPISERVPKSAWNCTFCTKRGQKVRLKVRFCTHFWCSFWRCFRCLGSEARVEIHESGESLPKSPAPGPPKSWNMDFLFWWGSGWPWDNCGKAAKCRQKVFLQQGALKNWNPEGFDQTRCSRTLACRICPE